jgi:ABC-2 type transport system permease protein
VLAVPVIALIVLTVSALGLLVGSATLRTRVTVLLANAVAYITMIVCGVNFPIEALPGWVQTASRYLPMTHGLLAVRALVEGSTYADVWSLIGKEALVGLVYAVIGYVVFVWQLAQARRDGKVELF